jgi:hypothetical protein
LIYINNGLSCTKNEFYRSFPFGLTRLSALIGGS